MSPAAAVAAAAVATWVWIVGSSLAPARPAAERIALGAMAAWALAWTAMAAGAAGVGILGGIGVPAGLALVSAAAVAVVRRPQLRAPVAVGRPAAIAGAAALVSFPALRRTPPELWPSHGDMLWHLGWVRQLDAGFAAPGGLYAHQPNGYPWLFHAFAAWVARVLPGGPQAAVEALQVLGLVLAAAGMLLLAEELGARPAAAAWSACLFLCAGGIGAVGHPLTVFEQHMHGVSFGPFHGDPVPALTPGLTFLPPMIPRDAGLAMAPVAVWLGLRAVRRPAVWWAAGGAVGLTFLVAPPAGIFAALWTGVAAAHARRPEAWRAAVAAAAVAAVWLVPLAIDYHRYHGFRSTTLLPFVAPTAAQAALGVGVAALLGVGGLALVLRRTGASLPLLLVLVPAVVVLAGAVGTRAGVIHTLVAGRGAPAPLVRWERDVPFLVLALCPPAGIAADALVRRVRRRGRPAAVAVAACVAVAAAGSTAAAGVAEWRIPYPHRLLCSALPADPRTEIGVIAPEPDADAMAQELFMRTGASVVYVQRRYLRVRFRTWLAGARPGQAARRRAIAAALRAGRVPAGADLLVVERGAAELPGRPLGRCTYGGATWDVIPTASADR